MPIYSSLRVCCRSEREMLFLFLSLSMRTSSQGYFWGLNIIACPVAPTQHINRVPVRPVPFAWFISFTIVCAFQREARGKWSVLGLWQARGALKLFPGAIAICVREVCCTYTRAKFLLTDSRWSEFSQSNPFQC